MWTTSSAHPTLSGPSVRGARSRTRPYPAPLPGRHVGGPTPPRTRGSRLPPSLFPTVPTSRTLVPMRVIWILSKRTGLATENFRMEPNISTFIYIFYVHLCFIHIRISNSSRIGFFIQICLSGRCTWLLHPILWTIFSYTLFFLIMTTFLILRQFQQFGIFAYNFSNSLETNFIFFQLSNYRISSTRG